MKNWNSYSPKEKAKLMQIFIRNGITDLNQMQEYINSFDVNTKKNLNSLDSDVQALNKPTPTTYNTGGKKQSVEMTPSEAEALNRKLDTSQYMLAVGSSPEDPVYLSPGYLEPATVKAFDSQEDYNRHIGDKFGEYVSNSISNAGTKLAPVLAGAAAFPFALNLGMAAYANPFVRSTLDIIGAIDGARNFSSDNGVRKTIRLAKEGDTWGAVKSGVGDLFDIASIGDLYTGGKAAFKYLEDLTDNYYNINEVFNNKKRITNVPQSVINSFDNNSYAYRYLKNERRLEEKDINKLRYYVAKTISKYSPEFQKQIIEDPKLLDHLFTTHHYHADAKDFGKLIDETIQDKYALSERDFFKTLDEVYHKEDLKRKQSINKLTQPLKDKYTSILPERISKLRPSLQEIANEVPNYIDEIEEYSNLGLSDEEIVKNILDQRFTFYRGFATEDGVNPLSIIQIPTKITAGRADRQVFGKLLDTEDVGYLSNSLETAIAYSYPEVQKATNKYVGRIKRIPESFNLKGTPIDWLKNNSLENANIKKAVSTSALADRDFFQQLLGTNFEKLRITNLNKEKDKTIRFLGEIMDHLSDPIITNNYFSHYLIKGNKGENYKNLYIDELFNIPYLPNRDVSELEKIVKQPLNKKAIVRAHYGINSPKASKNKYGGKLNTFETGGDKDSSYIQNVFLDPLSLATLNKINETKLGVPYRDFNSSDYSYYDANKNNMPIEEGGHWTSRNSETGQILKSSDHPTIAKEFTAGLEKGYLPILNPIDNLIYSIPETNAHFDSFFTPMRNLNNKYNIFEDRKANLSKNAHRESLDKFIENNPTLYGLNTADFADFFSQLAGLEGSYKKDAGKGMIYSGYYGLKNGRDYTEDEQHQKAFKHLSDLFQNSIVKEDILKGLSLGYSPAQILAKYWNQGNRVTQFLWNGVDDTDGLGTKISDYGWNITADADYLKYLKNAITEDEVKVKDAKSLNEAIVRVRKPNINYSNREEDILKFNTDRNDKFDTKKLKVGDTIYLTPLQKNK